MVEALSPNVICKLDDFPRLAASKAFHKFLLLPMTSDIVDVLYLDDVRCYQVDFLIFRNSDLQSIYFVPSGSGFLITSGRPIRL